MFNIPDVYNIRNKTDFSKYFILCIMADNHYLDYAYDFESSPYHVVWDVLGSDFNMCNKWQVIALNGQ